MKVGVNQLITILAAAGIISLSALYFNIAPVAIGAAADHRGFNNQQLGMLMVPGMSAQMIVSLLLSFWVRRINWKLLLLVGGACAFAGFTLAAFTTSFTTVTTSVRYCRCWWWIIILYFNGLLGCCQKPRSWFWIFSIVSVYIHDDWPLRCTYLDIA